MSDVEIVWLDTERTYAVLVSMNTYYSEVYYERDGIEYYELVDNTDINYLDDEEKNGVEN